MKKIYKQRRNWERRMAAFLGICRDCGKDSGGCNLCYECRKKKQKTRTCKIDTCNNILPKGTQFCDKHKSYRSNRNACIVNFNYCKYCGKLFTAQRKQNLRCEECWTPEIKKKICSYHLCNKEFFTSNNTKTTCGDVCSKRNGDYLAKQKRRAERKSNNCFIEAVKIGVLYERDGRKCRMCNKKLKLSTHFLSNKAPTIDHIIPLSKGGEHSYKNTQLLCRKCNLTKGNRPVIGGEQLLLFGT